MFDFNLMRDGLMAWINNHFEIILIVVVFWFIGLVVIKVVVTLRPAWPKGFKRALDRVLHDGLTAGLAALLFLTCYNFLVNFSKKEILDFSYKVAADTKWVKATLPIYFIVDNELMTIKPNGADKWTFFQGPDNIHSYHFSPDGKHLLVVTATTLFMLDPTTGSPQVIESVAVPSRKKEAGISGVIDGVRWNADSSKICYHVSRWGTVASLDNWVVFDLATGEKRMVKSPTMKMASLVWDETGTNLYYLWFEALDTSIRANPYEVKVYQIPLATLTPQLVLKFPYQEPVLPKDNLALRGIWLFTDADALTFVHDGGNRKDILISDKGSQVGIDAFDYLYYIKNRWWRRRLYQIPRVELETEQYQYSRALAVRNFRWLPGGRYVMMDHYLYGVLILEPATGKIGIMTSERNNSFGWYTNISKRAGRK